MVISCCGLSSSQFLVQPRSGFCYPYRHGTYIYLTLNGTRNKLVGHRLAYQETEWNFAGGSKISIGTKFGKLMHQKSGTNQTVCASSQIAAALFNLGTAIVFPLYTLMIVAPKQKMTKTTVESRVPYVVLGIIYAYVLALSWTPQHIGALFGGYNKMPDYSRVGVLFFSEMSSTAAWIHLLLIDIFCARKLRVEELRKIDRKAIEARTMETPKTIPHEIGGVKKDALRFGLQGVKSDIVGAHPLEYAFKSANMNEAARKKTLLAATYGSAFSVKQDLDKHILARFQRPPGAIQSSMLGLESFTGDLNNFGFEDYLLDPKESETTRPVDMHHALEVRLGLSQGPVAPSF